MKMHYTKHVSTVAQLVNLLQNEDQTQFKRVIPKEQQDQIIAKGIWDVYNSTPYIDEILKRKYYNYVVPHLDCPLEVGSEFDPTESATLLIEEIKPINFAFQVEFAETLNRIYDALKEEFNPIENYDRYETFKRIKSGNENEMISEAGTETDTETPGGSESAIKKITGEIDSENSGGIETATKNISTSYNTNQIDAVDTKNTDTTKNKTIYNNYTENTTRTAGINITHEKTFADRTTSRELTYNNVTNAEENHIHGNIGVTTSVAMLKEFTLFFTKNNFWDIFWMLWAQTACSPFFSNLTEDYQDEF